MSNHNVLCSNVSKHLSVSRPFAVPRLVHYASQSSLPLSPRPIIVTKDIRCAVDLRHKVSPSTSVIPRVPIVAPVPCPRNHGTFQRAARRCGALFSLCGEGTKSRTRKSCPRTAGNASRPPVGLTQNMRERERTAAHRRAPRTGKNVAYFILECQRELSRLFKLMVEKLCKFRRWRQRLETFRVHPTVGSNL